MHPDNRFYGHDAILRSAAAVADGSPLRAHVQHGWALGSGLADAHRLVRSVPKLVWSRHNLREARAAGIGGAEAIGAPFCYLAAGGARERVPDRGTIAYPHHGWRGEPVRGSHRAMIDDLVEREGDNLTVCLYWLEYEDLAVRALYENSGCRVVCHGRPDDPEFLVRQYDELSRHRRVVSNRVGSAIWYGGHLGAEIEVYGPRFEAQESPGEALAFDRLQAETWPQLVNGGLSGHDAATVSSIELGAENRRGPEELRHILGLDNPAPWWLPRLVLAEHKVRAAAARPRERFRRPVPPYARPGLSPAASADV